jgi:hypothetical protein
MKRAECGGGVVIVVCGSDLFDGSCGVEGAGTEGDRGVEIDDTVGPPATLGEASMCRMARVASCPFITGMEMSIRMIL